MIKYYRGYPLHVVSKAAKSILEHLFNNHEFCDSRWCKPLRMQQAKTNKNLPSVVGRSAAHPHTHTDPHSQSDAAGPEGRSSHPPIPKRPSPPATPAANPPSTPFVTEENERKEGYYRCKIKHKKLYEQMKPIWDRLTTEDRLLECMHYFDSQLNEALNTSVMKYARKGRTYCTTMSLTNRVMIAVGVHNLGFFGYWSRVFLSLGIDMSPSLAHHLQQKDNKKKRKRSYESSPERKMKRMKVHHEKMKEELKKQMRDFKRGATYGCGIAVETANSLPAFVLEDDRKMKPLKSQRCPLIGCVGRNHATSASKACLYYECENNEQFLSKLKILLKEKYPDKYGEYMIGKIDVNRFTELTIS